MSLIRLFFFTLSFILAFGPISSFAEETLALNGPATADEVPEWLPTARDINIQLIPDTPNIPNAAEHNESQSPSQNDLWARIREGFAMPDLDSTLVAKQEEWYAKRPDYVARMIERARLYLYYITQEVEKRGMPTEIALLPMVESAFNPSAYSVSRASGIWQFIPSTGKKFGMRQNWWYDGRRDIISATSGALDYLQNLHDMFGDWELALAAYNCGEGAIQRAQERNRKRGLPVDYSSLKLLSETRNYVPKLIAIRHIIADPRRFGLTLQDIPNEPYFSAVATTSHIDVKLAAKLADVSIEEFTALNPAHNRPVILQDASDVILLPISKIDTFRNNLANYNKPLVTWQSYRPRKGERLDKLAPRFGLSLENLKSVNGLSRRGNISTGQTLLVPVKDEDAENPFEAFNMYLTSDDASRSAKHTVVVRKGETLSGIARRHHVTIAQLRKWNGKLKTIRPGQTLALSETRIRRVPGHRRRIRDRSAPKMAQNGGSRLGQTRGG